MGRVFGYCDFPFEGQPRDWFPNPDGFKDRYDAPEEHWDWLLRARDPLVHRIEQEMQLPVAQRPVFLAFTLFADKFRRGISYFFCCI